MTTALLSHPDCLNHLTPEGHPETTARLEAILSALKAPEFSNLLHLKAPLADWDDIKRAHSHAYVESVIAASPQRTRIQLDADTYMSPASLDAARRAAGGAIEAVKQVLQANEGGIKNAFVAVRPPGHHAEYDKAMGFCLFSNVAIAAKYALDVKGLKKVAILDFDVHHGNGTQNIVENDPRILFISSHQMPLFPHSGGEDETGIADNVINIALSAQTGSQAFRTLWQTRAFGRLRNFAPDMIFISAGFDAHKDDPLANVTLETDDFIWITHEICTLAKDLCHGRIVSVLEGGYCLEALGHAVAGHLGALMEYGGEA